MPSCHPFAAQPAAVKQQLADCVLACDSDDDAENVSSDPPTSEWRRESHKSGAGHRRLPTNTRSISRGEGVGSEDSQLSTAAAAGEPPRTASRTPISAAKTSRSSPPRPEEAPPSSLSLNHAAALCAETLLRINATAHTRKERDAALAQLSRFRGAYRDLCRGAPFSVWVRYEQECKEVIQETADFFSYELDELIEARRARARARPSRAPTPKPDVVAVRLPGFRVIGARSPLPQCAHAGGAVSRSVCELQGTWGAEDVQREEEARLYAQLTQGEKAAITLLSMESGAMTDVSRSPSSFSGHAHAAGALGAREEDSLSPFAIYAADTSPLPHRPLTIVPFHKAPAVADLGPVASTPPNAPQPSLRNGKRPRDAARVLESSATARRLDFDSPKRPPTAPLVSLSERAVEQQNQRVLQEWFRASDEAYLIPY